MSRRRSAIGERRGVEEDDLEPGGSMRKGSVWRREGVVLRVERGR
jgi:hypothetical protein